MKLNAQEKNSFEALWQLVSFAKLKITETSLKTSLQQRSENNTIAAFNDILNEYNVPNMVARLYPEQLKEIPLPAIAFFEGNGGSFATVIKIEENKIEWLHNRAGIVKESIADFSQKWGGITLLIEPNELSSEANYKENKKAEFISSLRIPFIVLVMVTIIGLTISILIKRQPIATNLEFYTLLFTKSIGLVFSIMLIWHSIDGNNSFLKAICKINEKTNCKNILNSKAANVLDWLSWSEIGLFYFAGSFVTLLFIGSEAIMPILWLGVFALPYTFWSIYYQGFSAKEWCPMCLVVLVIIVIEFVIFLKIDSISLNIKNISLQNIFICFTIIPLFWTAIKKPLYKSMRTDDLFYELQKMKFNPEYVQSFMRNQRVLPPIFEGMKVIEMGKSDAENEVILVLSTNCIACSNTYWEIKKLIETNESINCKIILAASVAINSIAGNVAKIILSQSYGIESKTALEKWFAGDIKNIKKWITELNFSNENEEGVNQLNNHFRWLNLAGVEKVPLIFFNKAEIPQQYQSSEISKLLAISQSIGFRNQI